MRRALLMTVGVLLLSGVLFLVCVPVLDGPHSRQHAHEAAAVGNPRIIVMLQDRYLAAHPQSGYACELPLLQDSGDQRGKANGESYGFLTAETWAGYRFVLKNCNGKNGLVSHYEVSAIPAQHGVSGLRVFCADETRVLRYDETEVGQNCLTVGHVLN